MAYRKRRSTRRSYRSTTRVRRSTRYSRRSSRRSVRRTGGGARTIRIVLQQPTAAPVGIPGAPELLGKTLSQPNRKTVF